MTHPAVEIDLSRAKDLFAANVFGVMDINQTFLPQLLLAKGTAVHIGSLAGHLPLPFYSVYCASKAALYAYCESLRVELAPLGVRVTYVQTGSVKTNIFREDTQLREDSIFSPISKAIEKRQESVTTGGMRVAEFAKRLAQQILGGHSDVLWVGESAFTIRMLHVLERYLSFRMLPYLLSKSYGLDKFKAQ